MALINLFFKEYSVKNLEECLKNELKTRKIQLKEVWKLGQLISLSKHFVIVSKLLQILAIFPVSNALNERKR